DFCLWSHTQADLLRHKKFSELDLEKIIEEIDGLGGSDKRALFSHLSIYFQHMLKNQFTPLEKGNSKSWDKSIANSKFSIKRLIKQSPSLKKELINDIQESYSQGRYFASLDSVEEIKFFPDKCPWSNEEIIKDIME